MRHKRSNVNQRIMTGVVAMALVVLLVCWLFLSMVSCTNPTNSFRVEGSIQDAADSTLVLEAMTLDGVQVCDQATLHADGHFAFDVSREDSITGPEFYRLRIGKQVINFAVDSTESISVEAALGSMGTAYEIHGNESSRVIKTIAQLAVQLDRQMSELAKRTDLSDWEKLERSQQLVENYKQTLKADFILKHPESAAAYYALFQTLGDQMLFNPESDRNDVQFFAAVATQWDQRYPGSMRAANLKNIALRGLTNTRQGRPVEIQLSGDKIRESGIIDIGFPDIHGRERRLSDFPDKVVLLDFTAYSLPHSRERIMELRTLYNKYHAQGLEIYQVSVDADQHYWTQMSEQLPWVCVYCADGLEADALKLYMVQALPAFYLIGRGSEMQARGENIADLDAAIRSLL